MGALALEKPRIITRTAIFRCIKTSAGALASAGNPQFSGADGTYIAAAEDCFARRVGGVDRRWQIESIDERYAIMDELVLIDSVLDHRGRGFSGALTV